MKLVVIESPYAGDVFKNLTYVRACMRDCLLQNEACLASHALYTQDGVLNDFLAAERKLGMEAGFAWNRYADLVCVYADLGISDGMREGIKRARLNGTKIVVRYLGLPWSTHAKSYDDVAAYNSLEELY